MSRLRRAFGVSLMGATLALVAVTGLVLHATSALLAFAPAGRGVQGDVTASGPDHLPLASPGPRQVGLSHWPAAEAPLPLTVWYPALPEEASPATLRYAYGITMLNAGSTLALATYPGRAVPGASPDLAGGPYPMVVLSSGFAIGPGAYAWLAEHVASYGFVVAAPHHDESLDPQTLWRATADRPQDISAVLDEIDAASVPGGRLAGLVAPGPAEPDRVAVVGHSYGGYAALASAGARLDTAALLAACKSDGAPDGALAFQCDALLPYLDALAARAGLTAVPSGQWPSWADPRVGAAVAVASDAVMFGPDGLANVQVPLLAIGGTADADAPFTWGTEAAYEHSSGPRKAEVALLGAEHLVFTGGCDAPRVVLALVRTAFCADPAWEPGAARDVVAHYVAAFLLAELAHEPDADVHLDPDAQASMPALGYRAEGY